MSYFDKPPSPQSRALWITKYLSFNKICQLYFINEDVISQPTNYNEFIMNSQ